MTKHMKIIGEVFKIERDIPIPLTLIERMPLEEMEVGDSFFVATPSDKNQNQIRASVSSAAGNYVEKHNTGMRFTVRGVEGGVRVWRTE